MTPVAVFSSLTSLQYSYLACNVEGNVVVLVQYLRAAFPLLHRKRPSGGAVLCLIVRSVGQIKPSFRSSFTPARRSFVVSSLVGRRVLFWNVCVFAESVLVVLAV